MFHLAVRAGRLSQCPAFPDRLLEAPAREGFFEHAEFEAVRQHLPPAYQDVLDFLYYSGWRKKEVLDLRWSEVDELGGVVRLSPARSKTRVGRVLPLSPPIAAVLARRRAKRRSDNPRVFTRDDTTVRTWRCAWPEACRRAGRAGPTPA
jgi:integrase